MSASSELTADDRMAIPPPLNGEVRREKLDLALGGATRRPLTLVTAGPGWGKTTAIAAWARRAAEAGPESFAWLTLEASHDSPGPFWDAVLHAVRGPGIARDARRMSVLSDASRVTAPGLLPSHPILDAATEPMVLVLDDFQVITHPDVLAAVAALVSRPTGMRVVLVTRCDPPLPLHRLRLAGVLAEVGASDLEFDADDVRALAIRAESLVLSGDDIAQVLARTEGWPAGVRLAMAYLARKGGDPGAEGFSGIDKPVAGYLAAEVLHPTSREVLDFLLRTSVVEVVSHDLADAIVAGGRGRTRLKALEQANQFVVPADPAGTSYRYHPLLRDLLLHILSRDDPVAFREAHRAAASWFLANRQPGAALVHAIAAQDWRLVSDAFFDASPSILGVDRHVIAEHLRAIPFASLKPTAALELCAAALEFSRGHLFAMDVHVDVARRLLAQGDRLPPLAMALLENLTCAAARAREDDESVATAAVAALTWVSRAAPGDAADGNRLIATCHGAVALLRSGDGAAARAGFAPVVREASRGDLALLVLEARAHLAWCDLLDGDLDGAGARSREVIDEAVHEGWTPGSQMRVAYLALAIASLLRDDRDSADRSIAAARAAQANGIERWPTIALHLAQASAAVHRRRPRAATAALHSALSAMGGRPPPPALDDTLTRVAAEVRILTGTLDDLIAPRGHGATTATGWSGRARLALARGDLDEALSAARQVPRPPDTAALDDLLAAIEAAICEALITGQRRRPDTSAGALAEALALAHPQQISRPFVVMASGELARILRATSVPDDQAAFRTTLLRKLGESGDPGCDRPEPAPLLEPLTERELAVLAQLPTMRTNEEIALEFHVSVNTVKTHVQHVYRKFGVTNRREAVRRARALALLP